MGLQSSSDARDFCRSFGGSTEAGASSHRRQSLLTQQTHRRTSRAHATQRGGESRSIANTFQTPHPTFRIPSCCCVCFPLHLLPRLDSPDHSGGETLTGTC